MKMEEYYESIGFKCPEDTNPLDYAIDVALTSGVETEQKFLDKF